MQAPFAWRRRRWRPAVTLSLLLALRALPSALAEQTQPTFETQVNYVVVPVRVLDRRGDFVPGLTASDFRVREDGTPQVIASFTAVDIPFLVEDTPNLDDLAAAASKSIVAEGRVYAIVVDDLFLEADYTLKARNLVSEFVLHHISAKDIAALALTSKTTPHSFTPDKRLLLEALEQTVGSFDPEIDRMAVGVFRKRVRATLVNATQSLASIRDRQKALVLVSSGGSCILRTEMTGRLVDDGQPVSCGEMFDAAVRSGVTIYTIDPRGTTVPKCAKAEWSGETCFGPHVRGASAKWGGPQHITRTLAEETGGFAVTSTNNFEVFFNRIVREISAYYLIGYYSTNNRADGRFRKHDIRVERRAARVVHRAGYLAPRKTDRVK